MKSKQHHNEQQGEEEAGEVKQEIAEENKNEKTKININNIKLALRNRTKWFPNDKYTQPYQNKQKQTITYRNKQW